MIAVTPRWRRWLVAAAVASPVSFAATARADGQAGCGWQHDSAAVSTVRRDWPAPLDRPVTLHGREIPLRAALDRLAAAARLRFAYTAELLPLDRRVCVAFDGAAAGDVLAALLTGTAAEPVVGGADQVILAPARSAPVRVVEPTVATSVLDRVVVTGSTTGAAQRSLTVALDVLDGRQLAQRNAGTFSQAIDGVVPGMWVWEQSPSSLLARYGSIRGASSFGLSYPKVYIDGIEVANPLLLTRFNPESIERVEVIRGPQGAALYGADAISGVINVITRHDGVAAGAARASMRTSAGRTESDFAQGGVLAQNHALAVRAGAGPRSIGLDVSVGTLGAFVPGAFARNVMATGDVRLVGSRATLTGTARFFGEQAGSPVSPLLRGLTVPAGASARAPRRVAGASPPSALGADSAGYPFADTSGRQSVRQYTVGATGTVAQNERWTHSVVAGVDGYRLADAADDWAPIPSAADSALRAARGGADRATLRASSVAQLGGRGPVAATLTLAAEHSVLRERTEGETLRPVPGRPGVAESIWDPLVTWRRNTGLIAQTNASYRDAAFVTAGVRLERNSGFTAGSQYATLPMLGAAVVRDLGLMTVKARAAYGKGIRPPETATRSNTLMVMHRRNAPAELEPEEQSGVEGGVDLFWGRRVGLHVTRFDQRATGLIQPVAVVATVAQPSRPQHPQGGADVRRVAYELQNVGQITNRGWELEASAAVDRLLLTGALALVDSRVRRLAHGYTGDLRTGDRMLEVPARTASLTASWTAPRWFATLTAARASDWINYDRLALAEAFSSSARMPRDFAGQQLRGYWRAYDGVTRLRATLSRELVRGLALTLTGDNLLNRQEGEPDNITVLPGRTVTAGVKARF